MRTNLIILCAMILNLTVYGQVKNKQFADSVLTVYEKNTLRFFHVDQNDSVASADKDIRTYEKQKAKELLIKSRMQLIRQLVMDKVTQENIVQRNLLIQLINEEYKRRFEELPDDFYLKP